MIFRYVERYFAVSCLSICFSSTLNIASSDSVVAKFASVSDLNDLLVLEDKVCEPSTSSYRINLLNSLNNNYYMVFFDMIK